MSKMGCPDKPVASVSEDLFNISTYVNGLCSFVSTCDTPMTVSIQGDWGSGKTSMMNMMRENLQGSVWSIWFNTWQFSQFEMGESLVFSMMDVILKELDCSVDIRKKIIGGLVGFGKRIVRNVSDYTLGGEITGVITSSLEGASAGTDLSAEIMDLKCKFMDAVENKLKKEHRDRVVIFVDDLDRLQPSKAVELLEVLKLFLDCEKCVFILAVDYEVVTLGIREKFGDNVPVEKGKSFFDKIIQLPFKMPVAQYNVQKYVRDMLERMNISQSDKEVGLYTDIIRTSVGFNPRSMKRLFNTYQLLDIITKTNVTNIDEAVRKRVLFAIVCAQMCYEEFYLYLTSTQIDEDLFHAILQPEKNTRIINEIYTDVSRDVIAEKIRKLSDFVRYFVMALQMDDDAALSEIEIENLRAILKCSVVTSVMANAVEESSGLAWQYRETNKNLCKTVAGMLTDIGKFSIWMPRKAREDVNIYDISGYYNWMTEAGFRIGLEYYLSRIDNYRICIHLFLNLDGKGQEKAFFEYFGDNPLKLSNKPIKESWGRYRYQNVLSLNDNDEHSATQIANVVRNAYGAVCDFLNQK